MYKDLGAEVLEEIGTLLELQGENPFRCNAYFKAARAIQQLERNLTEIVEAKELDKVPGIGATLKDKIAALVLTDKLEFYDELRAKTPPGLLDMLRLPGVGPKKIKALYDQLDIDTMDKLKEACQSGQVAELKGFGKKTAQEILEGIDYLNLVGKRVRLDLALNIALSLLEHLRKSKGIVRMELCGSLRRRRETIKDIDILISTDRPKPIMDAFVAAPGVMQVIGQGETKSSIVVSGEDGHGHRIVMNSDLRVVTDDQFPFALNYFTGSKEHNVAMRQRAIQRDLKLNEYELAGPKKSVKCKTEEDLYDALDMQYVPPEMRENSGEIEAAAEHKLPELIHAEDLTGTFHCHTTWSDGIASLEEMANAAKDRGMKYLGIGDHSQSLVIANGLTPERVHEQNVAIDKLNEKLKGVRLFKGSEVDILPDGKLDFEDNILESFDYVVASVHNVFNLSEADMTKRILAAVTHPRVTMLGHLTGRLLLRRDGYKLDMEAILQAAAKHGTMIEINGSPQRQELDWVSCKRAKSLGVKLVINPDAHSPSEIDYTGYGVSVARRGWLSKEDIFNTLDVDEIAAEFDRRKK